MASSVQTLNQNISGSNASPAAFGFEATSGAGAEA